MAFLENSTLFSRTNLMVSLSRLCSTRSLFKRSAQPGSYVVSSNSLRVSNLTISTDRSSTDLSRSVAIVTLAGSILGRNRASRFLGDVLPELTRSAAIQAISSSEQLCLQPSCFSHSITSCRIPQPTYGASSRLSKLLTFPRCEMHGKRLAQWFTVTSSRLPERESKRRAERFTLSSRRHPFAILHLFRFRSCEACDFFLLAFRLVPCSALRERIERAV